MLDRTVLEKMQHDPRLVKGEGYFAAVSHLPRKIANALNGIVVAGANEMCFSYDDLFSYVCSVESELLCLSVTNGLKGLDYSKLPSKKSQLV